MQCIIFSVAKNVLCCEIDSFLWDFFSSGRSEEYDLDLFDINFNKSHNVEGEDTQWNLFFIGDGQPIIYNLEYPSTVSGACM